VTRSTGPERSGTRRLLPALAALLALAPGGPACSGRLSHDVLVPVVGTHVVARTVTLSGEDSRGNPATCSEESHEFVTLPTGETYGLNVDARRSGWFARNELSVTFYESGALKQVTLGSDPQVDETLRASADLVQQLGTVVATAAGARAGCPTRSVTTRETVRCVLPFAEWKANGYRCE
jgi:hypothetical protein